MRKIIVILVSIFILVSIEAKASEIGETVGYSVVIESSNLADGNIVCKVDNKFVLCEKEYSADMAGVYNEKPALYIDDSLDNSKPLISSGKAWVTVSSINGKISRGEYITTSKLPGVGMKAANGGNILGIAMDEYTSENKEAVGKIGVLIGIRSTGVTPESGGAITDSLKKGFLFPSLDVLASLRYWIAILICILSFAIGFIYYGKISKSGIEAMGRNPLAGKMIQINIVLNMVLITLIMIGGLALAYAIVVI